MVRGGQIYSFNLIDEPWILVRMLSGETREVSMREALVGSHEMECLASEIATQDFSILRLLIAVLMRSVCQSLSRDEEPVEVWSGFWDEGGLPVEAICSYLDEWHDRFDLFDDRHPFMQVPDLEACNGAAGEVRKLVADHPDGEVLFSVRTSESLACLTYAEAARWLVHVQAFDTSGIKTGCKGDEKVKSGKSYPIGCGWAGNLGGIYCTGDTLAKTLLLNLVLEDADDPGELYPFEDDLPVWERPTQRVGDEERLPTGMADIFTWQSRRVRLVPDGDMVTAALLTNGNSLGAYNLARAETMTCWHESEYLEKQQGIKPVYVPTRHNPSRAFWRGLASVLPSKESKDSGAKTARVVDWLATLTDSDYDAPISGDEMIGLHATGISYGTQNAVITEVIDDDVRISAYLLSDKGEIAREVVDGCLVATDEAVSLLGLLARRVELASGADATIADASRAAAMAEAYFELGSAFLPWVASIGPTSSLGERRIAWHTSARSTLLSFASQIVSDADTTALVGRKVTVFKTEQWLSTAGAERAFRVSLAKVLAFAQTAYDHANDKEG